jgi:hypothetical protein
LYSDEELWHVGVRNCVVLAILHLAYLGKKLTFVTGHQNVWVALEVIGEQIAQSVVFLLQYKVGCV